MKCDYCGMPVELVNGDAIYPHRPDLYHKHFYKCTPCDAYVGCHPGTKTPLGRLANAELRVAKQAAHAMFDPIWRSGLMSRNEAYKWLADALKIPRAECHIGMFDVELCMGVVRACTEKLEEMS